MSDSADHPDPTLWVLTFDGMGPHAPVEVRRWAEKSLKRLDKNHLEDVLLVASELVTNALEHGNEPRQVRMTETSDPCEVLIEVDDNSPEHPVLLPAQDFRPHGRGMIIVNKLAKVWGVNDGPLIGAKTVWVRVPCDGVAQVPCELTKAATSSTEAVLPPLDTVVEDDAASQVALRDPPS